MTGKSNKPRIGVAERIAQLNEIDKNVATLLQSAGIAINTLTVPSPESNETLENENHSIDRRKEDFAASSRQYFATLSSIDIQLRRHISALGEAEIIPSETTVQDVHTKSSIANSGLGSLDVGWLNSRNDHVEKMMEAELWKEAQELVHERLTEGESRSDDNDIDMNNESARLS